MKKFPLIAALFGLAEVAFHKDWFGGKAFAKFDEDAMEKIEAAVKQNDVSALEQTIAEQKTTIEGLEASALETKNVVQQALELNGLELGEGESSLNEAVATLGKKCKEFGENKNRHSFSGHNGEEKPEGNGLVDGYFDPNDAHNQID